MIAILALLGCVPANLTATESIEVYVLNSDGSILDGRFTVSNSGLFLGQGHISLDWIPATGIHSPYKRSHTEPSITETGEPVRVAVGPDTLIQEEDGWEFTVSSGEFDMRLQLTNGREGPMFGNDGWTTRALLVGATATGSLRSGPAHSIVTGDAIIINRGGDAPPSLEGIGRDSVYVFSSDFSIGIDQVGGDAVAWAFFQDQPLEASDAVLSHQDGSFLLDFRPSVPLYVEVATSSPHLASDPWRHLTYLEKLAGGLVFSDHIRRTRGGVARVYFEDDNYSARAIINVIDTD
jgi:hypothetical protein